MERARILLFDRSQDLRQALSRLVVRFNYELVHAPTSQLGLQRLHNKEDFALVVINGHMGDLSAEELLKAIRKWRTQFPAIIIAAPTEAAKAVEMKSFGPTGVVLTPVHLGHLLLKINALTTTVQKEQSIPVTMASSLALSAQVYFTLKDISETGCCLHSHFPMKRNHILIMESSELSSRLGLSAETSFPIRVSNCTESNGTKGFDVGAQFIGLTDKAKTRLRAACLSVKGFKFTGSMR